MTELTKEYFDQVLKGLVTKEDLNGGLKGLETRIIKRIDESQEELARMVAGGFEHTSNEIASLKNDIGRLEVGQENLKLKIDYLAPNFEVTELKHRVKRLEDKAGIKYRPLKLSA